MLVGATALRPRVSLSCAPISAREYGSTCTTSTRTPGEQAYPSTNEQELTIFVSTEDKDNVARAANLRQVSDYIKTWSGGNAVLVFGDTNSRYTRASDVPAVFSEENDMTDAWLQLAKGGVAPAAGSEALLCDNPSPNTTCEIVDKMWYRGSPALTLSATKFQYAGTKYLQANGKPLSDHDPVLVDFEWTVSDKLRVSDPQGGPHGDFYNDLTSVSNSHLFPRRR